MGPMFSGKSTELFRRIQRNRIANKKCIVIKFKGDNRYAESKMTTHDSQQLEAFSCYNLQEADPQITDQNIIGIDEGQFFPDLYTICEKWASKGKQVIIASLDGTFQRKPFGNVLQLIPLAEKVSKLAAVCTYCFNEAGFTIRLSESKEVELIGGIDLYRPVCRICYYKYGGEEKCENPETES